MKTVRNIFMILLVCHPLLWTDTHNGHQKDYNPKEDQTFEPIVSQHEKKDGNGYTAEESESIDETEWKVFDKK